VVDAHFEPLRRIVTGTAPGQPAPVDGVTALINELYAQLNATEAALKGGNQPPASEVPARVKAEGSHLPEPVRSMLQGLAAGGSSNAVGVARGNLSSAIESALGEFCRKAINGRYPFTLASTRDVTQDDFARLFAPGGLIDDFFQKNLAVLVNTSSRPWKFRDQGDATFSDPAGTLLQFQRAQTIRDVFFRGAQTAAVRLDVKPVAMDATITQFVLDVDGQSVKYSHGPQVAAPIKWPGPNGGTGVRYQLAPPIAGAPSGKSFEGAWALFRMFDQAQVDPTAQPEKFLVTFNPDGRKAQFEVTTSSVRNPFRLRELEQFQCPGRL
jgi:type VI secretion system protein ImpL